MNKRHPVKIKSNMFGKEIRIFAQGFFIFHAYFLRIFRSFSLRRPFFLACRNLYPLLFRNRDTVLLRCFLVSRPLSTMRSFTEKFGDVRLSLRMYGVKFFVPCQIKPSDDLLFFFHILTFSLHYKRRMRLILPHRTFYLQSWPISTGHFTSNVEKSL